MNPPLSIDARYPCNTLEGLIARKYVRTIDACEELRLDLSEVQEVIDKSRALMRAAGWPWIYQHNFLTRLRNDLTELTRGHLATRQFYALLTIELEF